jgi:hypothetical protein
VRAARRPAFISATLMKISSSSPSTTSGPNSPSGRTMNRRMVLGLLRADQVIQ